MQALESKSFRPILIRRLMHTTSPKSCSCHLKVSSSCSRMVPHQPHAEATSPGCPIPTKSPRGCPVPAGLPHPPQWDIPSPEQGSCSLTCGAVLGDAEEQQEQQERLCAEHCSCTWALPYCSAAVPLLRSSVISAGSCCNLSSPAPPHLC